MMEQVDGEASNSKVDGEVTSSDVGDGALTFLTSTSRREVY